MLSVRFRGILVLTDVASRTPCPSRVKRRQNSSLVVVEGGVFPWPRTGLFDLNHDLNHSKKKYH